MIRRLTANQQGFRDVVFRPGLNMVLADVTEASTASDTRNGLGKTTLLEIIHFCLGASVERGKRLGREELLEWSFSLTLDVAGEEVTVRRDLTTANRVYVSPSREYHSAVGVEPELDSEGRHFVSVEEWRKALGAAMFGLTSEEGPMKFRPTFRTLLPYFGRYRRGAFESPFKCFANQPAWSQQVNNAFLLGLSWEDASELQLLKERRDALRALRRAATEGFLNELLGSLGELEARRVNVAEEIARLEAQLAEFQVHPQYERIVEEANELTEIIHGLVNANFVARRKLELYEEQLSTEAAPLETSVVDLWEEAGAFLPDDARRRLDEVEAFHAQVIRYRLDYLRDEHDRLVREIEARTAEVEEHSRRRAETLQILETHGALDEYAALQTNVSKARELLADVNARIARIREIEEGESAIAIEQQTVIQRMRRNYDERAEAREEAISLFAANTRHLYGEPGVLLIDVSSNGFAFGVEIERSDSHGVSNMKIFSYDLMLVQRWAGRQHSPGLLFHDSELYDGVDERQVGSALQLAASESEARGFQYICTLNTDALPRPEFLGDLDLEERVVLRLTDTSDEGRLLGFGF